METISWKDFLEYAKELQASRIRRDKMKKEVNLYHSYYIRKYRDMLLSLGIYGHGRRLFFWSKFKKENRLNITSKEFLELVKADNKRRTVIRDYRFVLARKNDPLDKRPNHVLVLQRCRKMMIHNLTSQSSNLRSALSGTKNPTIVCLKTNLFLIVKQDINIDWHYYIKSYDRPKITISNRRVELITVGVNARARIIDTYRINTFRGNYLLDAMVYFYKLKPVQVKKELKKVQLNKFFSVKLIKKINDIEIYKRTINGFFVDYCIMKDGVTFYSTKIEDLVNGLRMKLTVKDKKEYEKMLYRSELERIGITL